MKISELKKSGAFVADAPVKKTIRWQDADAQVFVRKISFGTIAATQSLPEAERNIALVREGIRLGDKGDEQLSREQVADLDPALAVEFLNAIAEVNALGKVANDPNA